MTINYKLLDILRRGRTPHENHLIDGLVREAVSRREFLRYGSVLGLSAPLLGGITSALGYGLTAALAPSAMVRSCPPVPSIR